VEEKKMMKREKNKQSRTQQLAEPEVVGRKLEEESVTLSG